MAGENRRNAPANVRTATSLSAVRGQLERDPRQDIPEDALAAMFTAAMADAVAVAVEYGGTYAIAYRDREWAAERWDGTGETLRASTPGGIAALMRADMDAP